MLYLKQDNNNVIYSNLLSRGYKEDTEIISGELVTDGDFPTGTTAWNTGTSWGISFGKANYDAVTTGGELRQLMTAIDAGKTVKIKFEISNIEDGKQAFFKLECSGAPESVFTYTKFNNGIYTYIHTLTGGLDRLTFTASTSSTGGYFSIDNVSVKELQINTFSWLINITNDFTKESTTLLQLVDNSVNITPGTNTVSYPIKVVTSGTANGLNQEVLLKNTGYYSYEIYKQDSLTNLDVNNAVVGKVVESGKALVYNDTKEVNYKEQADGNPNNFIYVP